MYIRTNMSVHVSLCVGEDTHMYKYMHSLHSTTALISSVDDSLLVKGSNSTTSLTKPVVRN